jgi:predicted metal-binding protein
LLSQEGLLDDAIESREFGSTVNHKPDLVRQIRVKPDEADLSRTLAELIEKANNAGAVDAMAISVDALRFNADLLEQINTDTGYPSAHWPARYPKDDIREALNAYQSGIFFQVPAPPEMPDYNGGPVSEPAHRLALLQTYEITTLLESAAFYLGYHLVLGFATGNCRAVFCHDEKRCWATVKGRCCIHPYRARPSMAAVGVDAAVMAEEAGWSWQGPLLAGLVMVY